MAKLTRAELTASINNSFPDNSAKQITEEVLRNFQEQVNESCMNLTDDGAEDIKFSDSDISATNVQDAIKEVKNGGGDKVLFYVTVNLSLSAVSSIKSVSLNGSNYGGVSVSAPYNSHEVTVSYPDTVTNTGRGVRTDPTWGEKNGNTGFVTNLSQVDVSNGQTVAWTLYVYGSYDDSDYIVNQ